MSIHGTSPRELWILLSPPQGQRRIQNSRESIPGNHFAKQKFKLFVVAAWTRARTGNWAWARTGVRTRTRTVAMTGTGPRAETGTMTRTRTGAETRLGAGTRPGAWTWTRTRPGNKLTRRACQAVDREAGGRLIGVVLGGANHPHGKIKF